MGDQLFTDFLSKKTIEELRHLVISKQPSANDLRQLILKLETAQAFDKIRCLLSLIEECMPAQDHPSLLGLSHQILLAHACQSQQNEDIIAQLKALKHVSLQNEAAVWQNVVDELLQWIEQTQPPETIQSILRCLPPAICEKFYQRLLETATETKPYILPLIDFVLSFDPTETSQHLEPLARSLILAPISYNSDHFKSLSLLLTTPQLIDVTFQLRAIAATYTGKDALRQSTRLKQLYLSHYEELLTCLTIRATASESDYQELTDNHAELANLLMCKRLKLLDSVDEQRRLIFKLLEHCEQFNWQDRQFHAFILEHLVDVLHLLSNDEAAQCFERYYDYHHTRNYYAIIRLLDALLEKKSDDALILMCLKQHNDSDHAFIMNYLTASKTRDNKLLRGCLGIMDISQLINFCGPLVALAHLYRHEQPYILTIYCDVIIGKIIATHAAKDQLAQLAAAIPEQALDELVGLLFKGLKNYPQFQYEWLLALLDAFPDKTPFLSYCRDLLNQGIYTPQKVALLKKFSSKQLFNFYLYLIRNQAQEDEFNGFVELFEETDRQPILLYILSNTPLISPVFLNKILATIEIKNLVYLVESLVDLANENSDYMPTLEQLLLYFCSKLQATSDSNDPVHHWTLCQNKTRIAEQLLLSPTCFLSLCSRSSYLQEFTPSLLQNLVCQDVGTDLKQRIITVLNSAKLDEKTAAMIALNLLNHFRQTPADLHYLFNNLFLIENQLDEDGKQNNQLIKARCWALLKTHDQDKTAYEETQVKTLLSSQLATPHRFDGILTTLANNLTNNQNVHLSALYLTQIEPKHFDKINTDVVVSVLLHSMNDKTQENWKKVAQFLQDQTPQNSAAFVGLLVKALKTIKNNPLLINRAFQFICQLPQWDTLLALFNDDILQWLVSESPADFLTANLCTWLDTLHRVGRLPDIALGPLLALLPANPLLLNAVFQQPSLTSRLPAIFIELTRHDRCDAHCISAYQQINKLAPTEKRKAIEYVQRHLGPPGHRLSVAAPVLTMLILDLGDIQFHSLSDQMLILDQLKLFNQWAKHSEAKNPHFIKELESQLFNMIHFLNERDIQWTKLILGDDAFARLALSCLASVETKTIDRHPFTTLLLNQITVPLHPVLTKNRVFQHYVKQLLLNPPAHMQEDQFALLFDKLEEEERTLLALDLLKRPTLEDVQWSALLTLSRALSVEKLYEIYEKSKTRFVFIDLIVRHQQGINRLTKAQRQSLLANLDSGKQLLRILDSQTAIEHKFAFVTALFDYLDATHTSLESWLNQLNVDGQTLALLANYTSKAKHHPLQQLIEKSPYRQHEIKHFLANPTRDIPLNQGGLLYDFVRQIGLHPEQGEPCHPRLIKQLDLGALKQTLTTQSDFLSQLEGFPRFFQPFSSSHEVATETLAAARWLHRMPLLTDGLLEIMHEFKQGKDEKLKAAIQDTLLYKKLIQPLSEGLPSDHLFEIQQNELYALLKAYLNGPFPPDNPHCKGVQAVLTRYEFSLQCMHYAVPARVHHLFLPHNHAAKLVKGVPTKLHPELVGPLVQVEPRCQPPVSLSALLTSAANTPQLLNDKTLQIWLLHRFLFSPQGRATIEPALLNTLLSGFDPHEFATHMREIYHKLEQYQSSFEALKALKKETKLSEMIAFLHQQPHLNQLLEACEFAQLPHLSQLILIVLHSKRLALKQEQIDALLPPFVINTHVTEWLQHELLTMDSLASALLDHHHRIEQEGLQYRADSNNSARINELAHAALNTSPGHVYPTLNSYIVLFEKQYDKESMTAFTKLLSHLFNDTGNTTAMLSSLSPALLEQVTRYALTHHPEYLVEHLALHGYARCQQLASAVLQQTLATHLKTQPVPDRLDHLTIEQWRQIPQAHLRSLLRIQRVLFLMEPVPELVEWRHQPSDIKNQTRAFFCADASLLKLLTQVEFEAQRLYANQPVPLQIRGNLEAAFRFLKQENKSIAYLSMENFPQKSHYNPDTVTGHYYRLFAFLSEKPHALLDGFVEWLMAMKPESLPDQASLNALLQTLEQQSLLSELPQRLANHPLNPCQASWVYTQLKSRAIPTETLIDFAATAFDWLWLQEEMKRSNDPASLRLLNAVLQNKRHQAAILSNASSQQALLNVLATCHFHANNLITLFKNLNHRALRSLLAIHLLNRHDYLEKLSGHSLLTQLNNPVANPLPRRLQSLTQAVEVSMLTPDRLSQFPAETAASFLFSPLHFHAFNEKTTAALFKRLGGQQRDALIRHWLHTSANLPNAAEPFIALLNAFQKPVNQTLQDMDSSQRAGLLKTVIEHHHLLSESSKLNGLIMYCDESHLIYALQLYLHGRQAMQSLVVLIKHLVDRVDLQQLSPLTQQLLIRVTEDSHFASLQSQLSHATSDYLRQNAVNGNCAIFYDDALLAVSRLHKPLIDHNQANASPGFFGFFLKPAPQKPQELPFIQEPPALAAMKETFGSLLSLHYFLIHYQGSELSLKRLMTDYLHYASQEKSVEPLHAIAWLMTQPTVKAATRTVLFDSFCKYPALMDGQNAAYALRYDPFPLIKSLGLQKKYDALSALCQRALPYLSHDPETASRVRLAGQEADFEKTLSTLSPFLRDWRIWFKRCLFYGWRGWFVPKSPQWVTPFDQNPARSDGIFPDLSDKKETQAPQEKSLRNLLDTIQNDAPLEVLQDLENALILYDWQAQKPDELPCREKVDHLFSALLQRAKGLDFAAWLTRHMTAFLHNRNALLGLYCQKQDYDALSTLLKQAQSELPWFKSIADDMITAADPSDVETGHDVAADQKVDSPGLVDYFVTTVKTVTTLPKQLFWGSETPKPSDETPSLNKEFPMA